MKATSYSSLICSVLLVLLSSAVSSQVSEVGSWGTLVQGQTYVVTPAGFKDPPGPGEIAGDVVDPFLFLITGTAGEYVNVALTFPDSFAFDHGTGSIPLMNWMYGFGSGDYWWSSGAAYGDTMTIPIDNNGMTFLSFGATLQVPASASPGSYTAAIRISFSGKDTTVYRSLETIASTDVDEQRFVPTECDLRQNFPNPFNPSTTISYTIPAQSFVTLKVFNVLGQEVATLVNGIETPGIKSVGFDAGGLPSGVHFYRLQAGSYSGTKMLVLVR